MARAQDDVEKSVDGVDNTPLTDAQLAELQKLCDAATPGPWPLDYVQGAVRHIARNVSPECFCEVPPEVFQWDRHDDGPFIAASRTALPLVVAEVQRLRSLPSSPLSCVHGVAICLECAEDDYAGSPSSDGARDEEIAGLRLALEDARASIVRLVNDRDEWRSRTDAALSSAESARRVVAYAERVIAYTRQRGKVACGGDGCPGCVGCTVLGREDGPSDAARAFLAGERGEVDRG